MNLLVDTCTLLWWWSQPDKLSTRCLSLLQDPGNSVLVSAGSAWEVATKHRIGKYPNGTHVISQWTERMSHDGFVELPISSGHALRAGGLPGEHRDPFDRIIAAQAIMESIAVATPDKAIEGLGAERVW